MTMIHFYLCKVALTVKKWQDAFLWLISNTKYIYTRRDIPARYLVRNMERIKAKIR